MRVDPEAFHCPTCRSDFCFHCRAPVLLSDVRLQCINLDCGYYGKLVCEVCDPPREKEEPPVIYREPEDGYWPAWLIISMLAGGYAGHRWSWPGGLAVAAGLFLVAGWGIHAAGLNIFGRVREVEQRRRSVFHSCLCCNRPVKEVSR